MKRFSVEFFVGLFVLAGLGAVGYLTVQLGSLDVFGTRNYVLEAYFDNVGGLAEGARVDMSGVAVGKVRSITLSEDQQAAVVALQLRGDVKLGDDTIASIKTSGLIGAKYVKLSLGGSEDYLEDGDTIDDTESAVDLEELISKYVFGGV